MKRSSAMLAALSMSVMMMVATGCSMFGSSGAGWTALYDANGKGTSQFNAIGKANWRVVDGILEATESPGFLVTKQSYSNFRIRAEFYAESKTNSGIFIRVSDPTTITAANSYEVNIWDTRPDPSYGSGAIVDVARLEQPYPLVGGKWNTMEITAEGSRLTVTLNGRKTVDVRDTKFFSGPVALQAGGGLIRFRKVLIQPL